MISRDLVIEKLEPYTLDLPSDTLTLFTFALRSLVNSCDCDVDTGLRLLVSAYTMGMNSELTRLALKPSRAARMARRLRRLSWSLKSRLRFLMP